MHGSSYRREATENIDNTITSIKRQGTILDNLTEHRADRAQILLGNLANEDLVHIEDKKIPAFLRIDKDVKDKRELLYDFYKQYQNFDIDELDKQVRGNLAEQIAAVSQEYLDHRG